MCVSGAPVSAGVLCPDWSAAGQRSLSLEQWWRDCRRYPAAWSGLEVCRMNHYGEFFRPQSRKNKIMKVNIDVHSEQIKYRSYMYMYIYAEIHVCYPYVMDLFPL